MNEETTTTETASVSVTNGSADSTVTLFGHSMSFRGILSLILVSTLCYLTVMHPELFGKAFESITIAVIAFYFGQSVKK